VRGASSRARRSPLTVLSATLAAVVLVDLMAAAAVYVDRRGDPDFPSFRRANISGVTWDAQPYRDATSILATPVEVRAPGPFRESPAGHLGARAVFDPAANLAYALAALARHDQSGDSAWLARAERATVPVVRRLEAGFAARRATGHAGEVDPPAPEYSAATQGLLLSTLARLYEKTGETRWRRPSHKTFTSLLAFGGFFVGDRPAPVRWVSRVDGDGFLWFERFSERPLAYGVLSDQLTTALGVFDYRRALALRQQQRADAETVLAGAIATVRHYLPQFRVPGLISLGRLSEGGPDVGAHFVVKSQLAQLGQVTGMKRFGRFADLLDDDDDLPYFKTVPVQIREDNVDVYRPLPVEISSYLDDIRAPRVTYSGGVSPRGDSISPTLSARFALAQLDRHRRLGDEAALERAEDAVEDVLRTMISGAFPYRFREKAGDELLLPPRFSAEGQGLMLSALVRLHEITGEPRWKHMAGRVFSALTGVRDYGTRPQSPWVSFIDSSSFLWFDENVPDVPPFAAFDVHLAGVLGIYDYWRMTRSDNALEFFVGGVTTTKAYLRAVRQPGRPAIDSLRTGSRNASAHAVVTRQIASLAAITGDRHVARSADLLRKDYP